MFRGTFDFDSKPFDWGAGYKRPNIPLKDLVIAELPVRLFTGALVLGLLGACIAVAAQLAGQQQGVHLTHGIGCRRLHCRRWSFGPFWAWNGDAMRPSVWGTLANLCRLNLHASQPPRPVGCRQPSGARTRAWPLRWNTSKSWASTQVCRLAGAAHSCVPCTAVACGPA